MNAMKTGINIVMAIMVLLLCGCGASKSLDNNLVKEISAGQVMPGQLVVKDGTVKFDYTISLPPKTVGRTQTLKMNPVVKFGNQSLQLPVSYVQGQGVVHTSFPVVKHREAFEYVQSYQFPWQPGMEKAEIYLLAEVSRCGKIRSESETRLYSKGVQASPEKSQVSSVADNVMTGEIRGIIMFPMAEDRIISGQGYMKSLRADLDSAMAYPGAVLTSVKICVSCSPDGDKVFNTRLGEERYRVARGYFEEQLGFTRYMKNSGLDIYSYQVVTQNWMDLYDLLKNSDIPNHDEMIRTMSGAGVQERERLLLEYVNRYPVIKEQYLPSLRNAQIVIGYKINPVTVPGL